MSHVLLGCGRHLGLAVLVPAGLIAVAFANVLLREGLGPTDDTYIVFVYARHLVEGMGLRYDAAEPPLDGYTSLLNVLMKACLYLIQPREMMWLSGWLAAVLTCLLPITVYAGLAPRAPSMAGKLTIAAVAGALALHPWLRQMSGITLDTPQTALVGVLFVIAVASYAGRGWWRALVVGTLAASAFAIARPDSLLLVPLVYAIDFASRRRLHPSALPAFALVLLYVVARVLYFGHWAPNTYYAKRSDNWWYEFSDGIAYVARHLSSWQVAVPFVAAVAIGVGTTITMRRRAASPLGRVSLVAAATAVVATVLVVGSGGDCYKENPRFLCLPLTLCFVAVAAFCAQRGGKVAATLGAGVLLGFAGANVPSLITGLAPSVRARFEAFRDCGLCTVADHCIERLGVLLEQRFPKRTIGASDFQSLKWFNDRLRVIDTSGLNDQLVAHKPHPGRNLWGKASYDTLVERGIDVYFSSMRFARPVSALECDPDTVLSSSAEYARFTGDTLGVPPPFIRESFTIGSIRICGLFVNFLIRKELAAPNRVYYHDDVLTGGRLRR